jgi:alpha-tubulin suppressor-like RCC1 family protein
MEPQDEFIIKVSIGYSHVVFLNNLGEVYAR